MRLAALVLLTVSLAGCGDSKRDELVGYWPGTVTMSDRDVAAEMERERRAGRAANFTADQFRTMLRALKCSLTLNEDGTFTMELLTMVFTGKWSFDEMKIGLNPETLNGLPIVEGAAQLKLSQQEASHLSNAHWLFFSEDGKTITGPLFSDPDSSLSFSKPVKP
jgi:hypothetical protein